MPVHNIVLTIWDKLKTLISGRRHPYSPLLGALCIMSFAVVNGYAVMFVDSRAYVRGASVAVRHFLSVDYSLDWKANPVSPPTTSTEDSHLNQTDRGGLKPALENNGITASRSIYYGMLLLIGYLTSSFWLVIFFQSYIIARLFAIIMCRFTSENRTLLYFSSLIVLSLCTTLGPFSAYMMPDIFSGALIICFAILASCWSDIDRKERVFVFLVSASSVLFHQSNVAILVILTGYLFVRDIISKEGRNRRRIRYVIVFSFSCLATSFVGQYLFSYTLERTTGAKPIQLPYLTAHLVDMGPGYQYIRSNCPQSEFVLCKFESRLPIYWEDFLGLNDTKKGVFAPADVNTKHLLSSEQFRFVFAVARYDPWAVIRGLSLDVARQICEFSPLALGSTDEQRRYFTENFPRSVSNKLLTSGVVKDDELLNLLSAANLLLLIIALAYLCYCLILQPASESITRRVHTLIGFIVLGVIVNALVCGGGASPLDRYQARVIWLIPLSAVILFSSRLHNRRHTYAGKGQIVITHPLAMGGGL